jgi:P27 family predicted phage terminase small subunit
MMRPPADFDREAKATWRVALAELERDGSWTPAVAPLLEAYCRALATARMARTRIAYRFERFGEAQAYFSTGSTKQLCPHPDLAISRAAEADARALAEALLLSPSARRRAGVGAEDAGDDLDRELARLLGEGR